MSAAEITTERCDRDAVRRYCRGHEESTTWMAFVNANDLAILSDAPGAFDLAAAFAEHRQAAVQAVLRQMAENGSRGASLIGVEDVPVMPVAEIYEDVLGRHDAEIRRIGLAVERLQQAPKALINVEETASPVGGESLGGTILRHEAEIEQLQRAAHLLLTHRPDAFEMLGVSGKGGDADGLPMLIGRGGGGGARGGAAAPIAADCGATSGSAAPYVGPKTFPELYECEACSKRSGAPTLCQRCLAARCAAGKSWIGSRPQPPPAETKTSTLAERWAAVEAFLVRYPAAVRVDAMIDSFVVHADDDPRNFQAPRLLDAFELLLAVKGTKP